jgi:GTPase SAR1 family protein
VAVIVYEITHRPSFMSVEKWVEDVRTERGSEVIIFVVANKIDLEGRVVTTEEGSAKAVSLGVKFLETSAKTGINIKALFRDIATELPGMQNAQLGNSDFGDTVYVTPSNNKGSGSNGGNNCKC